MYSSCAWSSNVRNLEGDGSRRGSTFPRLNPITDCYDVSHSADLLFKRQVVERYGPQEPPGKPLPLAIMSYSVVKRLTLLEGIKKVSRFHGQLSSIATGRRLEPNALDYLLKTGQTPSVGK